MSRRRPEPTNLTLLSNRTKVLRRFRGRPQRNQRRLAGPSDLDDVQRTYAVVTRTARIAIATTARIARPGSPTRPGPSPLLRGSPPVAGVDSAVGDAASAAGATAGISAEIPAQTTARPTSAAPATKQAAASRGRVLPPAITRIASSGSSVVRISGRPKPAVRWIGSGSPPSPTPTVSVGTPRTIAWST